MKHLLSDRAFACLTSILKQLWEIRIIILINVEGKDAVKVNVTSLNWKAAEPEIKLKFVQFKAQCSITLWWLVETDFSAQKFASSTSANKQWETINKKTELPSIITTIHIKYRTFKHRRPVWKKKLTLLRHKGRDLNKGRGKLWFLDGNP